jgi:hypothetical protein
LIKQTLGRGRLAGFLIGDLTDLGLLHFAEIGRFPPAGQGRPCRRYQLCDQTGITVMIIDAVRSNPVGSIEPLHQSQKQRMHPIRVTRFQRPLRITP